MMSSTAAAKKAKKEKKNSSPSRVPGETQRLLRELKEANPNITITVLHTEHGFAETTARAFLGQNDNAHYYRFIRLDRTRCPPARKPEALPHLLRFISDNRDRFVRGNKLNQIGIMGLEFQTLYKDYALPGYTYSEMVRDAPKELRIQYDLDHIVHEKGNQERGGEEKPKKKKRVNPPPSSSSASVTEEGNGKKKKKARVQTTSTTPSFTQRVDELEQMICPEMISEAEEALARIDAAEKQRLLLEKAKEEAAKANEEAEKVKKENDELREKLERLMAEKKEVPTPSTPTNQPISSQNLFTPTAADMLIHADDMLAMFDHSPSLHPTQEIAPTEDIDEAAIAATSVSLAEPPSQVEVVEKPKVPTYSSWGYIPKDVGIPGHGKAVEGDIILACPICHYYLARRAWNKRHLKNCPFLQCRVSLKFEQLVESEDPTAYFAKYPFLVERYQVEED